MRLTPYLISAGAVAVVGFAAQALTRFLPLPHVSVLFFAAVILCAAVLGFGPSVFAAVLSVAVSSFFFYSPIFSFHVADAREIADLAVFLVVAAFTSSLAANVRVQAMEARRGRDRVAGLLAFSERLAASGSDGEVHAAILEHLAPVFGQPLHLVLPGEGGLSSVAALGGEAGLPAEVLQAAAQVMADGRAGPVAGGWRLEPLAAAHGPAGAVAARQPAPPADAEYVKALLGHAGLALERARLRREVADARVRRQGEALREALLNSVSHDLQTPLASILGSASALETFGDEGDPRARRELVSTIRGESERLASYIENVLDLTRIRSASVTPRLELVELSDIVDSALRRKARALAGHRVEVRMPADLPMLRLDLFLMEHAVANALDNAAKYAPPGTAIRVAAAVRDGQVVLDITDEGPGIGAGDAERVFEPFYRGAGAQGAPAPGTGLGLAICRAFVQASGGTVVATNDGAARGATLRFRLPIPQAQPAEEALAND